MPRSDASSLSDPPELPWARTPSDDSTAESISADHKLASLPLYHPRSIAKAFAGHAVSMLEEIEMIWLGSTLSPGSGDDTEPGQQDYFLRRRDQVYIPSTNVDQDTSGNYDPKSERTVAIRPSKASPTKEKAKAKEGGDDQAERPTMKKMTSLLAARQRGATYIFSFRLSEEKCQEFRDAGHADNWPDLVSLEEVSMDTPSSEAETADHDQSAPSSSSNHRLRKKAKHTEPTNPAQSYEHLKHHPIARGCKACFELGITCPLLDAQQQWPCNECEWEEIPCELLVPPRRKAACESCKDDGFDCSYLLDNQDHTVDCVACAETGASCRAGPAYDLHKNRLLQDGSMPRIKRPRAKAQRRRSKRKPKARAEGLSAETVEDSDAEPDAAEAKDSELPTLEAEQAQNGANAAATAAAAVTTTARTTDATVMDNEVSPELGAEPPDVSTDDRDVSNADDSVIMCDEDDQTGEEPARDRNRQMDPPAGGETAETTDESLRHCLSSFLDDFGPAAVQEDADIMQRDESPPIEVTSARKITTEDTAEIASQHHREHGKTQQPRKRKHAKDKPESQRKKPKLANKPDGGKSRDPILSHSAATDIIEISDSDADEPVPEQQTFINTCWAHPMRFMIPSSEDCLWCTEPAQVIVGLARRCIRVRVCRPRGNYGMPQYHEVSAGHGIDGYRTNMCKKCTLQRANIAECWHGALRPIPKEERAESVESIMEKLSMDVEAKTLREEMRKWCFICPEAATHECCLPGSRARPGPLHEEHSHERGCGLRVCSTCRHFLSGKAFGDDVPRLRVLDLRERLPKLPDNIYEFGYRADFELLSEMRPLLGV